MEGVNLGECLFMIFEAAKTVFLSKPLTFLDLTALRLTVPIIVKTLFFSASKLERLSGKRLLA